MPGLNVMAMSISMAASLTNGVSVVAYRSSPQAKADDAVTGPDGLGFT